MRFAASPETATARKMVIAVVFVVAVAVVVVRPSTTESSRPFFTFGAFSVSTDALVLFLFRRERLKASH